MATRKAAARTTAGSGEMAGWWWMFLVTGIIWLLAAMVVLRFDTRSITTVGIIIGVVFVGAAVNEGMVATIVPGWRWAHWVLCGVFVLGSLWAFTSPEDVFWSLASVLGFVLVFKGTFDIVESTMSKDFNDLWWIGLTAGILEVLLAFWVSQQFYPARADLLILWVGFAALFRGIVEIGLAFNLRRA